MSENQDIPEQGEDDLLDLDGLDLDSELDAASDDDDFLSELNDILDDSDGDEGGETEAALDDLDAIFGDDDEASAEAPEAAGAPEVAGEDDLTDVLDLDDGDEARNIEISEEELDLTSDDEPEAGGGDELAQLDLDELDLAGEAIGETIVMGDEEPAAEALAETVAAVTTGAAAVAMASREEPVAEEKPQPRPAVAAPAKRWPVALFGTLSIISLGAAGGAGFLAWQQMQRIDTLAVEQPPQASAPMDDPRLGRLLKEVDDLRGRLGELAVSIEGPMSHLRETNEQMVAEFGERLSALEANVAELAERPQPAPAEDRTRAANPEPVTQKAAPQEVAQQGAYVVNLASLSSESLARTERQRLQARGFDVQVNQVERKGKTWYRLQVAGFANYHAAQAFQQKLKGSEGMPDAWIDRVR